jgi:Flp pilus assembly pilin Flp
LLEIMKTYVYTHVSALRDREDGQAMVEYALILALVSVVAVAALTPLGTAIANLFTDVTGDVTGAGP